MRDESLPIGPSMSQTLAQLALPGPRTEIDRRVMFIAALAIFVASARDGASA